MGNQKISGIIFVFSEPKNISNSTCTINSTIYISNSNSLKPVKDNPKIPVEIQAIELFIVKTDFIFLISDTKN